MDDLLYFRTQVRNKTYKMRYNWVCKICGSKTTHMIGSDSLQQRCPQRHISTPNRICTKCGYIGDANAIICPNCEPEVTEIAKKLFEAQK